MDDNFFGSFGTYDDLGFAKEGLGETSACKQLNLTVFCSDLSVWSVGSFEIKKFYDFLGIVSCVTNLCVV